MPRGNPSSPTSSSRSVPPNRIDDRWPTDAFFDGRLRVAQSRGGYRFSIDAMLLAWYARPNPGERVLDLGTGCGIIPLVMASREATALFWGVDNQPQMAALAARNVVRNGFAHRIRVRCLDLRTLSPARLQGAFDRVVSNPPFRKTASGRVNPNDERAKARHEITATVTDVVAAAARMLKGRGRFTAIYPAERMVDMLLAMRAGGLEPKWAMGVQSREEEAARLVVVEGVRNGRPALRMEPPLCIYRQDGGYTEAVARMLRL